MDEDISTEVSTRQLKCELNVLRNPDGSAMFSQGETVFLAAVYGPVEVKLQKIQIDRATVEATFRSSSGATSVHDRIKENFIRNICECALVTTLHPRTSINIITQEMQDSGGGVPPCTLRVPTLTNSACSLNIATKHLITHFFARTEIGLTCAVNAACMALINSGLSMRYLFAAVSAMVDDNGDVIIDPDDKQLLEAQGTMTFVFDNVLLDVIGLHTDGLISEAQHHDAVRLSKICADQLFAYQRDIVHRYANTI